MAGEILQGCLGKSGGMEELNKEDFGKTDKFIIKVMQRNKKGQTEV